MNRLADPQLLLFLLLGLALANLWYRRRESRTPLLLVTIPFLLLVILPTPAVSYLVLGTLERWYPAVDRRPDDVEAIVVLGGGVRLPDDAAEEYALDTGTLNRCIKGAKMYRRGKPCPVLVSGALVDPDLEDPPVANLMKSFLLQLGVRAEDIVVENGSRNTYENAVEVGKIVAARGLHKIILVTDASHLPRAVRSFERQGMTDLVPCGCRYRADPPGSITDFLPDVNGPRNIYDACHEWLGFAWYWLRGR